MFDVVEREEYGVSKFIIYLKTKCICELIQFNGAYIDSTIYGTLYMLELCTKRPQYPTRIK